METGDAFLQFTHSGAPGSVYTVDQLDAADRLFTACYPIPDGWDLYRVHTKRSLIFNYRAFLLMRSDYKYVRFMEDYKDGERLYFNSKSTRIKVITIF